MTAMFNRQTRDIYLQKARDVAARHVTLLPNAPNHVPVLAQDLAFILELLDEVVEPMRSSTADLQALRERAEAVCATHATWSILEAMLRRHVAKPDVDFIAACSPDVVRSLLNRLEHAERSGTAAIRKLDALREYAKSVGEVDAAHVVSIIDAEHAHD